MLQKIGTVGNSVGISILSDSLKKKLEAIKDKIDVAAFTQYLSDFEIEFEKRYDGTIITEQPFYYYVKYHQVIEGMVAFVNESERNTMTEDEYIDQLHERILSSLKKSNNLSFNDSKLIREFLSQLLTKTKEFLFQRITLSDRGIFYMVCQNNARLESLERSVKERFQIQDQMIQYIYDVLSRVYQENETKECVKSRISSWNSRQIKNLGDRYTPDLNIPVSIMNSLHGASIDQEFQHEFSGRVDEFLMGMRDGCRCSEALNDLCDSIEKTVMNLDFFNLSTSDIDELSAQVKHIEIILGKTIEDCQKPPEKKTRYDGEDVRLFRMLSMTRTFINYLNSKTVSIAISPYIVLTGDGGAGKTHLIADYVDNQNTLNHTALLLLGQVFTKGTDALACLPTLIGCDITYHELFNILEEIACDQGTRVLICIDALNEGAGVAFWNGALGGIVDYLRSFPHIGLLVSVRTQYEISLFEGQDVLKRKMHRIKHSGFASIGNDAINQYFSFYGISIDSMLFSGTEFRNPLFLRLFCTANRNSHISLGNFSLPSVYSQYINVIEQRVSDKCCYNSSLKIVSKIINEMVNKRIHDHCGSIPLSLDETLVLITDICKKWNISADVYSSLLAEGVLTQGVMYNGTEYVHVTYERLEDYYLAQRIVDAYSRLNEEQFLEQYSWIMNNPDLLQFFGIILAENWEFELNDVFPCEKDHAAYMIREAFLYGLLWRKTTSITDHTVNYINQEILRYEHSFTRFIDVLFSLSTRPNHRLNAQNSCRFFSQFKMPDRDAAFIPVFDELYSSDDSALHNLVEWGLDYSQKLVLSDEIAEACATMLAWVLISPNNRLRDRATKAMICILHSHMDALLSVMKRFEEIDDPYVAERLYCVAFGCAVNEDSPYQIKALAEYAYKNVYDKDTVYPNILLRNYAKNIIDYAFYVGCVEPGCFDVRKITPPYNSTFPSVPSDEEIQTYKLDYRSESFKEYYWPQLSILNSMKVEYSRDGQPGGYGDFGRYTFQAYFYDWKQLHPMDLKNIAIKRIFELGYDVEKHGVYDRHCKDHGIGDRLGRTERIGKKYQWIALYELAAQVCDNFEITVSDYDIGEQHREYCRGSFEPDIRNIDPTILPAPKDGNLLIKAATFSYDIPNNSYEEWLRGFSDTPSFEKCVIQQNKGQQFFALEADYNWTEAKHLGFHSYDLPRKNMWQQIRSYIVRNEHAEPLVQALSGVDFMGRWMPESQSNSSMYNKEYYWSDAYALFSRPDYYGLEWVSIDLRRLNCDFNEEVLLPVKQYYSERRGDLNSWSSEVSSISWYKPCEEIFAKMRLKYISGSNSALADSTGELVCFSNAESLDDNTGFYIRFDKLLEFLNSNGYSLIWTSLKEKRILTPVFSKRDLLPKAIHESSVYTLKDGRIVKASETLFEDSY